MNDLKLKADLDWLNTQGVAQISTSTWPLTANEIKRALNTANAQTPAQLQILQSEGSPADATSSTHTRREWVTPLGNACPTWTFSSVTSAATPPAAAVTHSRALSAACRSRSMPAASAAVSGYGISGWSMPGNW